MQNRLRLPESEYSDRPWRVHEITRDFDVEDVWDLPTPGGPDDLDRLVRQFTSGNGGGMSSPVVRALFALRWRIGALLGWDKPETGLGAREGSLRERLPDDLLDVPRGPDMPTLPFRSVFQTRDEWVAEAANTTCHAVMHIGWVPDGTGSYHGQMTALVKPNGVLGKSYMAAIAPLRHRVVYPRLITSIGQRWRVDSAA